MRRTPGGRTSQFAWLGALLALAATITILPPATGRAQQKRADPEGLAAEPHTLQTEDGFNLRIKYYRSTLEKDAAVVVLLHMKDRNRFVWEPDNGFAKALQSKGFAVITVDLRYHGESKVGGAAPAGTANQGKTKGKKDSGLPLKIGDYQAMWEFDMEAVKKFIFEEHQAGRLNMNKMGIVGPEMGASIAVAFTVFDWNKEPFDDGQPGFQTPRGQDVRALVLISPEETFHGSGIKLPQLMPAIKDPGKQIAVLICSGNDLKEEAQAKKIFDMVNPPIVGNKEKDRLNSERMYLAKPFPAKLTGTDLLDKQLGIEKLMLNFFEKHLKNAPSVWRDRESKRKKVKK
jgi:pimeloyl-ACP methyl ester carboxylesterase